jgi:hypothetical protein
MSQIKFLCISSLVALLSFIAQAKVLSKNVGPIDTNTPITLEWDSNKQSGTAWIDVEEGPLHGTNVEDQPYYEVHRIHFAGLSYSSAQGQVIYNDSGKITVCSTKKSGFFGSHLHETGRCTLSSQIIRDPTGENLPYLLLTLQINE